MAVKRNVAEKATKQAFEAQKKRYNDPNKIEFRQGRLNELHRQGADYPLDYGATMSQEPDVDSGARRIKPDRRKLESTRDEIRKAWKKTK